MAAETLQQTELTIVAGAEARTEDINNDNNITQNDNNPEDNDKDKNGSNDDNNAMTEEKTISAPTCFCGEVMVQQKSSGIEAVEDYDLYEVSCDYCRFEFHKDQSDEYYYRCPKQYIAAHPEGERLCINCAQYVVNLNPPPILDIHNTQKLYFMYTNHQIHGPMTGDDILTMYVTKKLGKRIYITRANEEKEWTQLKKVTNIVSKLKDRDEKRYNALTDLEKANEEFKQKYPELYEKLIKNMMNINLRKMIVPVDIPKGEKKSSILRTIINILGRILAILMTTMIIIHCLPTFIPFLCIFGCVLVIVFCIDEDNFHGDVFAASWMAFSYSGIIVTPILIVHFALQETDKWDEIQSWMIAYITWGAFSFIVSASILIFKVFDNWDYIDKIHRVIMIIMGVDLGDIDPFSLDTNDSARYVIFISSWFVFPSLAGFLPAAIAGFIANFVLEEKFQLKCGEDITSTDLCFEKNHGCCDIISSHDYRNSYSFIGGLVSNIIGIWAAIRLSGYLVVNAFPALSLYAKRKK